MGMIAEYRRMTADEFAQALEAVQELPYGYPKTLPCDQPSTIEEMEAEDAAGRVFRLEKEWHALHFLLTGDTSLDPPSPVPPPLGNVVFGGAATPFETGYGPVRCLNPQEVREVADALRAIPVEELQRRFTAESFNEQKIYGYSSLSRPPGGWTLEDLEPLLEEMYPDFVEFFGQAAETGDLVLISVE
jgi:Domain of unknown function (DUF1877)